MNTSRLNRERAKRVALLGAFVVATIVANGALSFLFAGLACVAAYDLGSMPVASG